MNYIIIDILQTPTNHKKAKPDASGANVPDGAVSNSGTISGKSGIVPGKSGVLPGKSSTSLDSISVKYPANVDNTSLRGTFTNQNSIGNKHVEWIYTSIAGREYGTYDSTKDLVKFKSFGLSLSLFVFSFYLFYVAARLYHQYFDKNGQEKYFTIFFLFSVAIANIFWVWIILEMKGLPSEFLLEEFLHYPDQFIFVMELASLLLLTIGVLRFTLIAFLPNSEENEKKLKDSRFSIIGIVVGLLSVIANIIKIWEAFRK
jgi:hypothetical protein